MLPRRKRLSRAAFPAALTGPRRSSKHLAIVFPRTGAGYAVVISKKTARLAVTRHRIRRRVMAALRGLPLPASLVLFPKASILELSPAELKQELAALLP